MKVRLGRTSKFVAFFSTAAAALLLFSWPVFAQSNLSLPDTAKAFKATFNTDSSASDNKLKLPETQNKKFDKKDEARVIEYMKLHEKHNLAPVFSTSVSRPKTTPTFTPTPTAAQSSYFIQPILFIPSDMAEGAANVQAIAATFQIIKRWYSGPLQINGSGYTFRIADVSVYHAPQPFSYYKCADHALSCDNYDGVWGNVLTELTAAGYPMWTAGQTNVIFVKGAGGWAGSSCGFNCGSNWPAPGPAGQGGASILGDWALDGISGVVNPDCFAAYGTACYQEPQMGAVGHEVGHTFGLAHANDQFGSIMFDWWDYPFISLMNVAGNDEVALLRNQSPFFFAQACGNDVQTNQVSQPATVKSRSQFNSVFAVTNYGYCRWNFSGTALTLVRDAVWGVKSQSLTQDLYPAQPKTFTLALTAPVIKGTGKNYSSIWQMKAGTIFFGPQMGGTITVTR